VYNVVDLIVPPPASHNFITWVCLLAFSHWPYAYRSMYIGEFWTFAYAREAKFGHTEHFLRT